MFFIANKTLLGRISACLMQAVTHLIKTCLMTRKDFREYILNYYFRRVNMDSLNMTGIARLTRSNNHFASPAYPVC